MKSEWVQFRHMRLFIAIFPPEREAARIASACDSADLSSRLRWTEPPALHVTVKFLGSTPPDRLAALSQALRLAAGKRSRFALRIEGAGAFPSLHRPVLFWLGVGGDVEPLRAAASEVEAAFAKHGFPGEERPYRPHMTVAKPRGRMLGGEAKAAGAAFAERLGSFAGEPFVVDRLWLVESHTEPGGARYERLFSAPLADAA